MDVILGFQEVDEIVMKGFKEPTKGDTEESKKAYKENKKPDCKSLQRQYELLSMGEQKTIEEYVGRIQVVVNAMRVCDKVVKDRKIVEKILRTLTPQYDHIAMAIEESKDLEKMRVEELQNSLEAHEQRLIERRTAEKNVLQSTNQALQARSGQTYKNHGTDRGREKSRGGRGGRNGGKFTNIVE
ncbi:uncharacterized protein LOC106779189 [Vigna radiata var. radiata]|uniref:Uncharacterized protein LOC106779189 n=1 Tax=Vigna radiata var. radiata TaxID=3916 RepID=A0A1S3VWJ1_VIGRR|nr:uncharacterized protein LOC106779189 [Vigna radiata var. radiata]